MGSFKATRSGRVALVAYWEWIGWCTYPFLR
ncbi:DUF6186 family protein [Pseudomonas sp. GM55]